MAAFTGNSVLGQVVAGDGHVVSSGQHGVVNGVTSAAVFGVLAPKTAITRAVAGLSSAQSFGALVPRSSQSVQIPGLSPSLDTYSIVGQVVSGDGHLVGGGTRVRFGRVVLAPGRVTVQVGGVTSAQQFPVTLKTNQFIKPSGLNPPQDTYSIVGQVTSGDGHLVGGGVRVRFGRVTITTRITIQVAGIGSAQQFGVVHLKYNQTVLVGGVPSTARVGMPAVYRAWVRPMPPCTDLDLAPSVCTDLDLVPSSVEDIDLVPVGCE